MGGQPINDTFVLEVAAELRARYDLDDDELRVLGARLVGHESVTRRVESDAFAWRFVQAHAETLARLGDDAVVSGGAGAADHDLPPAGRAGAAAGASTPQVDEDVDPAHAAVTDPAWLVTDQHFGDLASFLLGEPDLTIRQLPGMADIHLAFHAPFPAFGYLTARDTLVEQAAVLLEELLRRRPLPRDNARVAFALTARFLEENGRGWGAQDAAADATAITRVASGRATADEVVAWIDDRARPAT